MSEHIYEEYVIVSDDKSDDNKYYSHDKTYDTITRKNYYELMINSPHKLKFLILILKSDEIVKNMINTSLLCLKIKYLGRQQQNLSFDSKCYDYLQLNFLPNSLKKLIVPKDYDRTLYNLPNKLLCFILDSNTSCNSKKQSIVKIEHLSFKIEELHLLDIKQKIKFFPQNLKVLTMDIYYQKNTLFYDKISKLQKLVYLDIKGGTNEHGENEKKSNILPPNLEFFKATINDTKKDIYINKLPQSLLYLNIKTLNWHYCDNKIIFENNCIPKKLLTLSIGGLIYTSSTKLPDNLVHLNLFANNYNDNLLSNNIKYLTIKDKHSYKLSKLIHNLDCSSDNVSIKQINRLNDIKSLKYKIMNTIPPINITANLHELYLTGKINKIKSLPDTLKYLILDFDVHIDTSVNIFDDFVFPSCLEILGIYFSRHCDRDNNNIGHKILVKFINPLPDHIKILGFNNNGNRTIPLHKFPKSIECVYAEFRPSSFCNYFVNKKITDGFNNVELKSFESRKQGSPLYNLEKDYFKKEEITHKNYTKNNYL
jgi:hypothetical protein